MDTIRTVGHGTLDADAFASLVRHAGGKAVIDVRRFPGSRRHPHFGNDEMSAWLPNRGVEYRWLASLGGRRKLTPGSPNVGLRNPQFPRSRLKRVGLAAVWSTTSLKRPEGEDVAGHEGRGRGPRSSPQPPQLPVDRHRLADPAVPLADTAKS